MKCLILLVLITLCASTQANITLTANRLVFDSNERADALQFRNTSSSAISFSTEFSLTEMTEQGSLVKVETSNNSAIPMIRYSPKRGTIAPGELQVIRFSIRRPANAPDGEYRAVLRLTTSIAADKPEAVALNTKLAYNMPVIVRKGRLTASTSLQDPRLVVVGNTPHIELWQHLDANRSTYGNFEIFDENDNKVGTLNSVATYTPLSQRRVLIPLNETVKPGKLSIKYQELIEYGGDLTASTELIL